MLASKIIEAWQTGKDSVAANNKQKIWQIVHAIPKGKVASYGQVANMAELPGYARYVGHVMKSLPVDSQLPWHRVVNSRGQLSFPRDSREYRLQKSRLEAEGIVFVNGRFSLEKYAWR